MQQLKNIEKMLGVEEESICKALHADLRKPHQEGWIREFSSKMMK
jgi:hypothetical protein